MAVEDGAATRLVGSLIVNGLYGNGVDPKVNENINIRLCSIFNDLIVLETLYQIL